ncbi:MAG: 50S ribosomal protein L17 [Candidatus Omnitrophica bacterium]|nr:50S ribosomal protein L17 [Candidatus Omnitrophota bacterium]
MRHRKNIALLGKPSDQRKALIKSLAIAVIASESIKTTYRRAKECSRKVDRLISWGKKGDIHSRRQAYSILQDRALVKKLFQDIAPRFKGINGGYTRVLKLGKRRGDNAQLAILELTKIKEEIIEEKNKIRRMRKEKKEKKVHEETAQAEVVQVEEEKPAKKKVVQKKDSKKEKIEDIKESKNQEQAKKSDKEDQKKDKGFLQGLKGFLKRDREK